MKLCIFDPKKLNVRHTWLLAVLPFLLSTHSVDCAVPLLLSVHCANCALFQFTALIVPFWRSVHRPKCAIFRWYHASLKTWAELVCGWNITVICNPAATGSCNNVSMIQGAEKEECCCLFRGFLSSPFLSTWLLPLSSLYLSPDNGSFSLLYSFLCLSYISPQTTVHSLYFTPSSVFLISLLRQRFILSTLLLPLSSLYLSSDNGSFSLLDSFLCLPYISPQTTVHSLYLTPSSVFLISLPRQRFILSTLLLPLSSLYLSSDNGSFSLLYSFLCLPYISPQTTVHSLYFTPSSVFLIYLLRQRFIISTLLLPLSSLYLSSDNGSFSLLDFFLCLPYISPQTTVHSLYLTSSSVFLISLLRQRFILSTWLLPLSSLYLSPDNGSFSLLYFFLCLPYISPQTTVHSLYFTSSSVFLISLPRQRFILSTLLLPLSSLYLSPDNGSFSLLYFFLCLPYISPQTTVHSLYFTSSSVFLISLLRQRFILSTLLLPLSSLYLSSDNGSFSLLYFFLCLPYISPQTTVHSLYFTSSSVFLISLLRQRFILSTLLLPLSSLYLSSHNGSYGPCFLYTLFHVLRFSNQLNEKKEPKRGYHHVGCNLMETTRHLAALIIQQGNGVFTFQYASTMPKMQKPQIHIF